MKSIDSKCVLISDKACSILSFLCYPIKYCCRFIAKYFQRPYSLMFCFNFILLILPGLLLLITLIQFHSIIIGYRLWVVFYYSLAMIGLNYYFSFVIYEAYQEHYIPQDIKPKYSVSTFLKYVMNYFRDHKGLCVVGIMIIIEVITSFIALSHTKSILTSSYNDDYPILGNVLLYGLYCNIIFALEHIGIYLMVLMILLCTINNSCICLVCCCKQHLIREIHYTKLHIFIQFLLQLIYIFGLFDYKKVFCEQEEESMAQNEESLKT